MQPSSGILELRYDRLTCNAVGDTRGLRVWREFSQLRRRNDRQYRCRKYSAIGQEERKGLHSLLLRSVRSEVLELRSFDTPLRNGNTDRQRRIPKSKAVVSNLDFRSARIGREIHGRVLRRHVPRNQQRDCNKREGSKSDTHRRYVLTGSRFGPVKNDPTTIPIAARAKAPAPA